MLVCLCAGAALAAALWLLPVRLCLCYRLGGSLWAVLAVGPLRVALLPPRRGGRKKPGGDPMLALGILRRILPRARVRSLALEAATGGDANQSALLCGALRGLFSALSSLFPKAKRFARVIPDFSGGPTRLLAACIVSWKTGHITRAVLSEWIRHSARRYFAHAHG